MEMCSLILKSIFVFIVFSSICYCSGATIGGKVKRGGNNWGIYPFPRVGRSGGHAQISSPHELFDSDYFHEMKRQSLMAFPRVGRDNRARADPSAMSMNEANNAAVNGLWWGPRLGRFQKRGPDFTDGSWGYVSLSDFQKRGTDYTPRLGRDSEELLDDTDVLDEPNRTGDKASIQK